VKGRDARFVCAIGSGEGTAGKVKETCIYVRQRVGRH